ncbi:MAG: hypothetical protein ACOH1O_11765 [Flavobacterium sp.]
MGRILYTTYIFLCIAFFLISCNGSQKVEEDKSETAIVQEEAVSNVETLTTDSNDITGIYKSEAINAEDSACAISVEISGSEGNYKYLLRSKKQDLNGVLIVGNSELKGEQNLMLFTEKFDISTVDNNASKGSATSPNEIEDTFNNNAILIVNAGSNKDSFTFFNDCNRKYIKLSK